MSNYDNYMFNRQLTVNGEPMYPLCNSLLYILSIRDKKVLMAIYMAFSGEKSKQEINVQLYGNYMLLLFPLCTSPSLEGLGEVFNGFLYGI